MQIKSYLKLTSKIKGNIMATVLDQHLSNYII